MSALESRLLPSNRKILVSEIPASQLFWGIFKLYGFDRFFCVLGLSDNLHPNGLGPKRPADQSGFCASDGRQVWLRKRNTGGGEKAY